MNLFRTGQEIVICLSITKNGSDFTKLVFSAKMAIRSKKSLN